MCCRVQCAAAPGRSSHGFYNRLPYGRERIYKVYPDCAGWFTFQDPDFVNTMIPGATITMKFVISNGGRAIHAIVTSPHSPRSARAGTFAHSKPSFGGALLTSWPRLSEEEF